MKMTLRWFGPKADTVSLKHIRQIPGVVGVISTLFDKQPGELWTSAEVRALKAEVEAAGLELSGIESVNIHDSIKTGAAERDKHIETYIKCLTALGEEGINLVCYNFMPVFDWTRSDLAKERSDGSFVLSYDQAEIDKIDPLEIFASIEKMNDGHMLPGWEPERMARIEELFAMYKDVDEEKLFENLAYFLKAIGGVCEKYGINMAIHPDDPAWPVFGLPRIVTNQANLQRLISAVDKPYNGVTLCTGSLGSNPKNDIPAIIRSLGSRIHFGHVRNLIHHREGAFDEAAHLSSDGSMDMAAIMKAFHDIGFTGPIRPDHGRMIWEEQAMPGYGLYDRALGAQYLLGIWEALEKYGK
ncbi:MAG: mannonate dehydratase [Defluviitaleaceae bacterium]|nr:mannonate dehydratase [Defluviitaleaceae bacterium]